MLVAKTLNGCKAGGFKHLTSTFIYVDYPGGCCAGDYSTINYKHMDDGLPMWPMDETSLPPPR